MQRTKHSSRTAETPGVPDGFGSRRQELLRLERKHFPKTGRAKRIRRSLEALEAFRTEFRVNLDLETVKWIAQDTDILDI